MLVESLLLLAIAVSLFRTFFAEGYMISTGSMAPTLLGYHKQAVCPDCQHHFARGTSHTESGDDRSMAAASGTDHDGGSVRATCRCPNCGSVVPEEEFPRNEGDQLLVNKHIYNFRDPRRWEVAVFRNPQLPMQAYVKRVVGLPGETVELIDGDLYANGDLQRKPLAAQLALRIPVDDHDHQPVDRTDWQPRWRLSEAVGWSESDAGFRFTPTVDESTQTMQWLTYRHWLRFGGSYRREVQIDHWPSGLRVPNLTLEQLSLESKIGGLTLVAHGAMTSEIRDRWLLLVDDYLTATSSHVESIAAQCLRNEIVNLYTASHIAPPQDIYGYNHPDAAQTTYPVGDLMFEFELDKVAGEGAFAMQLDDGRHLFEVVFDYDSGMVRLYADDNKDRVLREASLPDALRPENLVDDSERPRVLISAFDRQVIVAVNGSELFSPLLYAQDEIESHEVTEPVRIGSRGLHVVVTHVGLFRDVYYTPSGHEDVYTVRGDEFFVLGDNSPISVDSRVWEHPTVPRKMLIGRPFVVHLPSKQVPWSGDPTNQVRVPDFSRVRYIR